jgi:hypothetical protein
MLAYVLALAVGLGSLAVYMAAFFFPEVHRKGDFIWSGIGLFYALVLWICAGRITGGVLLGQVAGVTLLGWSVTQTLQLRRELTPHQQKTELPSAEEVKSNVQDKVSNLSLNQRLSQFGKQIGSSVTGAKDQIQQLTANRGNSKVAPVPSTPPPATTSTAVAPTTTTGDTTATAQPTSPEVVEIQDKRSNLPVAEAGASGATVVEPDTSELVRPDPPPPELVDAAIRDAEEKAVDYSPPETAAPHPIDLPKDESPEV